MQYAKESKGIERKDIIVQNIWQSSFIAVCGKLFAID
jgi:hypothetical protein